MEKNLKRRKFLKTAVTTGIGFGIANTAVAKAFASNVILKEIRIGIVGLAVHSAAFSQILNDPNKSSDLNGCRVTALYHPKGNPDVDFTKEQLDGFEKDIVGMDVKIVGSMKELLAMVDVLMIETNDGRPHLEQVLPAFKAGKPVFIDKPIGASLKDVVEILDKASQFNVPVFSSSGLRYIDSVLKVNKSEVLSAFTYSPAAFEKSHTELFWYGIHGVELLYTAMGEGCKEVMHVHHTEEEDLVIGFWENGRVGTFRGIRNGRHEYGGTVFQKKENITLGTFGGYRPLVVKIVEFFLTNKPPVPIKETLEIYAFMEAAQESRKRGGVKVSLEEIFKKHNKD